MIANPLKLEVNLENDELTSQELTGCERRQMAVRYHGPPA
jgi:hypothetical protein